MTLPLLPDSPSDLFFRPLASSSPSSIVVALVDRDPLGEVLRLCGGDGRLSWLVSTATDSALPLPFKKLGGDSGDLGSRPLPPPIFDARGAFLRLLLLDGIEALDPVDSRWSTESPLSETALEARGLLGVREPCFGGCGNAPILTTFRSDFPCGWLVVACSAARVGTEGEVMCFAEAGRRGEFEYEMARFDGLGRPLDCDRRPGEVGFAERCFGTGKDGRGPVGGAMVRRGS
jgi:hypothetical protein